MSRLLKYHKVSEFESYYYELRCYFVLLTTDPTLIDIRRLNSIKEKIAEYMTNIAEDPAKHYQTAYINTKVLYYLVLALNTFKIPVDLKPVLKYAAALEKDKLSYISFVSSLTIIQNPEFLPCCEKALSFWDDLNYSRENHVRLELFTHAWVLGIRSADEHQLHFAQERIGHLISQIKRTNDALPNTGLDGKEVTST